MFSILMATVGVAIALVFLIKLYYSRNKDYWKRQPGFPELDTSQLPPMWKRILMLVDFVEVDKEMYRITGDKKFAGLVEFAIPALYVKDLDLVKQILVKDFDHFVDRPSITLSSEDKVVSEMLTSKTGKEWKDLRSTMSPAFTTGKIRRMFQHFNNCANALSKYLHNVDKSEDGAMDLQDAFGRFTLEAIASIVFAIQGDSFKKDSKFKEMAKKMQALSVGRMLRFFLYLFAAPLARVLRISVQEPESSQFFSSVIKNAMRARREKPEEQPNDFLQMMLEAQAGQLQMEEKDALDDYEKDALLADDGSNKKSSKILDDITILSQTLLFFVAGFDTMESLLTFTAYELALNQEVQEKLFEEVKPMMDDNNGSLTYDGILQLPYLEMVVSETLRHHPPAFATARLCTSDYAIPGTNFIVPKGTQVTVPINSIHHDSRYYSDPEKFNPENFSPENKNTRHPYSFLPFGQGPRNCIAMRFAMIEAKAAIAHLVYNFKIEPCQKTQIPLKISKSSGIKKPEGGMWLKIVDRR